MASYRKRGNRWEVSLCVNGVRDSTTKPTKAEAQAWAREREGELLRPQIVIVEKTGIDMVDRYMEEYSEKKRGARWELLRANHFKKTAFVQKRVASIEPSDIAGWRDARLREVSGATVQREMILWSHMFSVAWKEWGWIPSNPCAMVKKPKSAKPRDRTFTDDEIQRICSSLGYTLTAPHGFEVQPPDLDSETIHEKLESVQYQVALVFLFALETAMRSGEILALRKSDVDLDRRVAHIRESKTGYPRDVPLSGRAVELLSPPHPTEHQQLFRVAAAARDVLFRRALVRAGVHGATFHDARHTAITRLARKLSPLELARTVGHRDLKMLLVYYNESAADLAKKL